MDLVELLAADHHLLVDRVEVLRAALDVRLHAELLQLRAERGLHLLEELLPFAAARLHEVGDLAVRARVQRLERQVLELPLQLLDTEAVGERGVDLERLVRVLRPARLGERRERAHVVQAVGELHEQDADVARHRDDHLADVLRLGELAAAELQLVQLGEPVDDPRDLVAELLLDVAEARSRCPRPCRAGARRSASWCPAGARRGSRRRRPDG